MKKPWEIRLSERKKRDREILEKWIVKPFFYGLGAALGGWLIFCMIFSGARVPSM